MCGKNQVKKSFIFFKQIVALLQQNGFFFFLLFKETPSLKSLSPLIYSEFQQIYLF